MFFDLELGPLSEPLTGKHWDRATVHDHWRRRLTFFTRNGLTAGDRVFMHYGNTPAFFVDLAAIWSLGACAVPIDPRLTAFEIETLAEAASPRFSLWSGTAELSLGRALAGVGVELLDVNEAESEIPGGESPPASLVHLDGDALILFTSGTTGAPKGVVHTHRSLRARWAALRHAVGLEAVQRSLCLLPTHFGHGLICNSLFPWLNGQHLFILPPFRPDLLLQLGAVIDEHRITFMSSVPTVWRIALKTAKPPQGSSLIKVFCGSAPLSAHLWSQIRAWCRTDAVWNAYGITETGSWLAGTSLAEFTPEDGLVGMPWGGVVRVLRRRDAVAQPTAADACAPGESGHVWVNTPALMRGYLGRDDLTAEVVAGGWFSTGDIGVIDDRGLLYLRGREREEINKGGMKIYPGDIDAVVERVADVADVCTFAVQDAVLGEDVGIALVLRAAGEETVRDLYRSMAQRLAKHQMPKSWYIVDEIPRTSRGKVNRAEVAASCASLQPLDMRQILRGA